MPVKQQEQTKPCEVSLEIEVEQEAVSKAVDDAYKEVGKRTQVPGFRKGKAPRNVLERYVQEEHVLEHAAEKMVGPAYTKALEETGIEPFAEAKYEISQLAAAEPFVFKAIVPLPPKVELGEYKGIEVEKMTRLVTDEDLDNYMSNLLERMAKVEPVEDRPVEKGDLVTLTTLEPDGSVRDTVAEAGADVVPYDQGIIGMEIGETKSIEYVLPEAAEQENESRAGVADHVTATVKSIQKKILPELNDEFVKGLTKDNEVKIDTVEGLRSHVRKILEESADQQADDAVKRTLVKKVIDASTVNFPDAMLDYEVAHRFQDMMKELEARNLTIEGYLQAVDQSFEHLRSEIERASTQDITTSLVIMEVAKKENIEATDEDMESELQKMAESNNAPVESVRAYIESTQSESNIKSQIVRRKALDFLLESSNIKNIKSK